MLNLGGGELLAIGIIGLISLGPEQLPAVMRKLGAASAQMRSFKGDVERQFLTAIDGASSDPDPAGPNDRSPTDDDVMAGVVGPAGDEVQPLD